MKKIFALAAAASLALSLSACSDDEEKKAEEAPTTEETTEAPVEAPEPPVETPEVTTTENNLPLVITTSDVGTTYQLANGDVTITAPNDWLSVDDMATEMVPVVLSTADSLGYFAVSVTGPSALIPDPQGYAEILAQGLGMSTDEILVQGEVDLGGYPAQKFGVTYQGISMTIYSVIAGDTAYELTTYGEDVYGDAINQILQSLVLQD